MFQIMFQGIEKKYRNLVCPTCHNRLNFSKRELICENCDSVFPIAEGIPCFTTGSSDWKLDSTDDSNKILKKAKEYGWEKSLNSLKKNTADWIRGTDRFPIAFFAAPKGHVLDIGCGWGGLSFWMANEFESVYGLDIELDGLKFMDIRALQEGIQNIHSVQGSIFSLPFPDNYFDLVMLNGVLEWIGTFSGDTPPLVMQERALKEISRVLQPKGSLYIGIENRFGLQYFLGYKEEHTGLRFISLLPRRIAQIYHKLKKKTDYRSLTHSRSALKKILNRSKFNHFEYFSVFPSYRNCRYAASLKGHCSFAFIFRNFVQSKLPLPAIIMKIIGLVFSKFALPYKIGSFFSPSWIVFASQQKQPELQIYNNDEEIINTEKKNLAFAINNRRANLFTIDKSTGRLANKYSIPINLAAKSKIEISKIFLDLLAEQKPELKHNIPEVSIFNHKNNYIEATKAIDGTSICINNAKSLYLFLDLLKSLALINIPENIIKKVPKSIDIRDKLTQLAIGQGLSDNTLKCIKSPNFIHGDLNKTNIYIANGKPVRAILLDFEHAKIGPFVLNWYDFICRNLILYGGKYPLSKDTFLKRFTKIPGNKYANPLIDKITAQFLNACNLPLSMHRDMLILYIAYLCQDPIIRDFEAAINLIKSTNLKI
jgi:ubiquinone/menaquinone biosynthesis C-methylase UbiE